MRKNKTEIQLSKFELNDLCAQYEQGDYLEFSKKLIKHIPEITEISAIPRQLVVFGEMIRDATKTLHSYSTDLVNQTLEIEAKIINKEDLSGTPRPYKMPRDGMNDLGKFSQAYNAYWDALQAGKKYYADFYTPREEVKSFVEFFATPKEVADFLLDKYSLSVKINDNGREG